MQTLRNTLHNTQIRTRSPLEWEEIVDAAYRAKFTQSMDRTRNQRNALALYRRINRALCGMADCACGTVRY